MVPVGGRQRQRGEGGSLGAIGVAVSGGRAVEGGGEEGIVAPR